VKAVIFLLLFALYLIQIGKETNIPFANKN